MLVEAFDRRELQGGLEQRVQHVEAGLVGGEPGALDLHAAEGAHVDVAVRRTAPRAAPVFELGQLARRLFDDDLYTKLRLRLVDMGMERNVTKEHVVSPQGILIPRDGAFE